MAAIGYKVVVEERIKVAMLQQADEDVETVGLKRINLYRFDAKQVKLLMATLAFVFGTYGICRSGTYNSW